jgi:hypothetical protein
MRLGLDLDNTLIFYDEAFLTVARERGLLPVGFSGTKRDVRARVRALGGGEELWQALQGHVYGKGLRLARLYDGVLQFLARAKSSGADLYVVSHKSLYGHFDTDRVNLREAAMQFLDESGVLAFVPRSQVFFRSSRDEKLETIAALGFDAVVDDLEEVFLDSRFPLGVRKILLSPTGARLEGAEVCTDWSQIERRLFDA